MCTLTYIPDEKNGYFLTQNRDESPKRVASGLITRQFGKHILLYPKDSGAGGTWIVISNQNQFVALLNGAQVKHSHRPPYRRSRGLMVLDFFAFANAKHFFEQYTFEGMEPFTMIIYQNDTLYEIRWDAQQQSIKPLDIAKAHLWASSTLYPPDVQQKRQTWFRDWLTNRTEINLDTVLHFHQTAGDGDPSNDLVMNRNNLVCTTSITTIQKTDHKVDMQFIDLIHQNNATDHLKLSNEYLATFQK